METGINASVLSQNNKYSSTRGVYAMLLKTHPKKMDGIGLYTIADYSSIVMTDYLNSFYTKVLVKSFPLGYPKPLPDGTFDMVVSNNMVPVPLGVHRLLYVYDENMVPIKHFHYDGSKIVFFPGQAPKKAYAEFLSLPFEENPDGGVLPLVIKGGEMACFYFCLMMVYSEDFALGRISGSAYGLYTQRFDEEVMTFSPMKHITEQTLDNVMEIKNTYYGHPFEYSFTSSYENII